MAREKQESIKVTQQPRLMNVAVGNCNWKGHRVGGVYLKCGSLPLYLFSG